MKDESLPKRSETTKQGGCRKRGRPQLRWEDCLKKDMMKPEREEKLSEKQQREMEEKLHNLSNYNLASDVRIYRSRVLDRQLLNG